MIKPIEVSFRFYAHLNDLLPVSRQGRRFTCDVTTSSSVKDAIEALGVPHPEVDIILINGVAEEFSYRLRDGDDVSVYPAFRTIEVNGVRRVGTDVCGEVRFVVDQHLGKLASLLRLAGFDAALFQDDETIAEVAAREGRVVLTRDVGLLKRRMVRHGCWVRHTDPERQFTEVLERFDVVERMAPFTRCLRCNTRIVAVDPALVGERVPPRTRAAFREFWRCPGCDRIFWRGSHYERLSRVIERARRRLLSAAALRDNGEICRAYADADPIRG